ncbi:unnamed protein product [Blepharisma stoltei]|uniref:Histidine kinase n=1 Tax=Blepharisma stoltei TaxID=1481888 RepID=A0AAU9JJ26_9CILI|nr:unnamed protein product [Blepharisma stoltei]
MMMRSFQRFLSRRNLENAEKRLNLIFNLFPHGILIISERNEILYSNENLLRLLNCELAQLIPTISDLQYCQGRKQSELSPSNKIIEHVKIILSLELNQQISLGVSKCGATYLEWRAQKVLWGEQNGILLTVSNVNHIIQLEKTTSDNKLKNVLLRSVSHELRTPINSIKSLAESLKNDPEISPFHPWKEKLNIISVSTNHLLSLINDLLDYSKVLVGMFSIQKSNFALWNSIYEVIQLIKIQATKKGLQIFTRIDPQLPINVHTDPLRLSQVLLNLLSNALKFTLKGSIEIRCMLNEKNQLKITVKDTGIGISEEKMKNLFKEFGTYLDKDLNPVGCGLGLWISNIIAQELGSSIEVKSKVYKGSSFSFCVNIFDQNTQGHLLFENETICEIPKENKLNLTISNFDRLLQEENTQVLIVDDNDFNRLALGSLLSSYKILFNEACTGKEAITKVLEMNKKRKSYKLIIMDGSMPELNGWEAAKNILGLYSSGKIDNLPVIIGYTAFTSDAELSLCIESGMKECIIKPCNSEILINKITNYLSI